jgi:hypothetical protein
MSQLATPQPPDETPSFAELQAMAKVAAATTEVNQIGIQGIAGWFDERTGKMYYQTPGLEKVFEDNPELHEQVEDRIRSMFQINDQNPTTHSESRDDRPPTRLNPTSD